MNKCPHCGQPMPQEFSLTAPQSKPTDSIPAWMPTAEWEAFLAMRKKIPRAPWTAAAQKMTINKIDKLRQRGFDPAELLESATMSSWRTVYEPKGNGNSNGRTPQYEVEREQMRRVINSKG